jgi:hypothetical protein
MTGHRRLWIEARAAGCTKPSAAVLAFVLFQIAYITAIVALPGMAVEEA